MLVMTATPIPRTIAMTVFGDLDISTLTDKPAGRAEVVTHIVPASKGAWLDRAWRRVREEVEAGRRAFVVCARIEGDAVEEGDVDEGDVEDSPETRPDFSDRDEQVAEGELALDLDPMAPPRPPLHAVEEVVEALRAKPDWSDVSVVALHGRMRSEQKDAAMARFASGEAPVMVCTTVIEVGVDVPEASVMLVLDADHFGLSQLHQLRGRIGRGTIPGVCLLVSASDEASPAHERLSALVQTTDGFALAEKDLELRREGDVLGAAQSGVRNSLKLLRVITDKEVIEAARQDATALVDADPDLAAHPALASAIAQWLEPEREEYLERT
jgi:ATP-dependent DNA helicase RecG